MEVNGSNSHSTKNQPSEGSNNCHMDNGTKKDVFVNHAEIAWHERRRQWVGNPSERPRRMSREPFMSWTVSYEDLLLSKEPFPRPIPLADMVDYLVDIWDDEGLYD